MNAGILAPGYAPPVMPRPLLGNPQPVPMPYGVAGDPFWQSVVLYLRGDGLHQSRSFTDLSPNAFRATRFGNAELSATVSRFGYTSVNPGGSGGAVQFPAGTAFQYGTGDFTVEAFLYMTAFNASGSAVFSQTVSGTNYFLCSISAAGAPAFIGTPSGGGTLIFGPGNMSLRRWHHFAITRASSTVRVFLDGVSGTPTVNSTNFSDTTRIPTVGNYPHNFTTVFFSGFISELRITKGVARYTSSFAPITAPFPTF